MIETLSSPESKVNFTTVDGVFPFFHKYPTPISRIQYGDTVFNTMTRGIDISWKVSDANEVYSTSYNGRVPFIKFYYGNGIPETILDVQANQKWSIDYNFYFKAPITENYNFYFGGSGEISNIAIYHDGGSANPTSILSFDAQEYSSVKGLSMTAGTDYQLYLTYRNLTDREAGLVFMWDTDSNSVTPDKIVMSGAVCSPFSDNTYPTFSRITQYKNISFKEEEKGSSVFKFEVPFIDSTDAYNYSGFHYDRDSDSYLDTTLSLSLKKYRQIKFDVGYKNKEDNEEEYLTKFTGQIRDFKVKYNSKGQDTLEITCFDYSIFTNDNVNLISPTPVDYWQAGYLVDVPGKVNGDIKPRAFDGWELYKVFDVILTESYIDPYTFYKKKKFKNYINQSTSGSYYIESIDSQFDDFLSVQEHYGIPPIGEVDPENTDDEYAYAVNTGEKYRDFLDEISKNWYYRWGFNQEGFPYLRRINAPHRYYDISTEDNDFVQDGDWHKTIELRAFKGSFLETTTVGAIASVDAIGKKFVLMVTNNALTGTSDANESNLLVTIRHENTFVSSAYYNTFASTAHHYVDGPNKSTGINTSILNIANGLPYDSYRIVVDNVQFNTRIEGLLAYNEEYEVALETFYTGESQGKGTISELAVKSDLKDHRTGAVVLGRRTGTQFRLDADGNQVSYNPNNEIFTYIQSAARDLNSLYSHTATNYVGHPRTTVIVDPSIVSQAQADFIAFSVVQEYGTTKKQSDFALQGNPHLQVDDCVAVVDDLKSHVTSSDFVWITSVDDSFGKFYSTKVKTTPIKLVDSYWESPDLNVVEDFEGDYIRNLKTLNRGYWSTLYFGVDGNDSGVNGELFITKNHSDLNSSENNDLIPRSGYCRLMHEIIKYDSADIDHADYIRLKGLTRNLGEQYNQDTIDEQWGTRYTNGAHVVIAHNPYSISQAQPIISFDLLINSNVEVAIHNYVNNQEIVVSDNLVKSITSIQVDAVTVPSNNPSDPQFVFLKKGHYEFVWGGFDRIGEYNTAVKLTREPSMLGAHYFARENFSLSDDSRGPGLQTTFDTGFGRFYAEVTVIPENNANTRKIYETIRPGTHLSDYDGEAGTIKQILMNPGVVDLVFDIQDMFYVRPQSITENRYWLYGDSHIYQRPNREVGGLFSEVIDATNYPITKPTGADTAFPVFILNRSNKDSEGNDRGFKFVVTDHSIAKDADIIRTYDSKIRYDIVQFGWHESKNAPNNVDVKTPIVTHGLIGEHEIESIITGNEYYFNAKKTLFDKQLQFIPQKWKDEFLLNATSEDSRFEVSNVIFFSENMRDLSGRLPKQRRAYKELVPTDTFFYDFDRNNYGIGILPARALTILAAQERRLGQTYLPYTFNCSTTNTGFYEFTENILPPSSWKYAYILEWEGYPESRFDLLFLKDAKNQFKTYFGQVHSGLDEGVFTTNNDYNVEYQTYNTYKENFPWNRNNYITWMDEDAVREIIYYNYEQGRQVDSRTFYTYDHAIGPSMGQTLSQAMDGYFFPNIWARYQKKDFSREP